jgi:soluble lytic murein transglycosylase
MSSGSSYSTARRRAGHRGYASGASRRRRPARGRRRLGTVVAVGGIVLLVALVVPRLNNAVHEFALPLHDASVIRHQASEKDLDPALIAAVIYAETKFEPSTSSAGAEGLMQILPETANFIARRTGGVRFTTSDLATPAINVAYGSYYLRYLLDHYQGDEMLAVAAYNGGLANVDRWVAGARAEGHALQVSEIPFPETRAYVERVLRAQRAYRATYPSQLGVR